MVMGSPKDAHVIFFRLQPWQREGIREVLAKLVENYAEYRRMRDMHIPKWNEEVGKPGDVQAARS
jgi:hypothetical protein